MSSLPCLPPKYEAKTAPPPDDDIWIVVEVCADGRETEIASCDGEASAKAIASALNAQRALLVAQRALMPVTGFIWSARN